MKLDLMLAEVKHLVAQSRYNYKPDSWFRPSDIISYSNSFKYKCKRLYEAGLLERRGDSSDRWGYFYSIKQESSHDR